MIGVLIGIIAAFIALRVWGLRGVIAVGAVLASAGMVLIGSGFLLGGAIQLSRYISTDPEGAAEAARALSAAAGAVGGFLAAGALGFVAWRRWRARGRSPVTDAQPSAETSASAA